LNDNQIDSVVLSRRRLLIGAGAVGAGLLLVGCGDDDDQSASTGDDGNPGSAAPDDSAPATTASPAATTAPPGSTTAPPGDTGSPTGYPTEVFVMDDVAGTKPDLPRRAAFANLGDAEVFAIWGDNMEAAAAAAGVEYVTASAGFDPATNVEQMQTFLASGVGAMFVVDLDVAAQRPVIDEAMDSGVAVFTVNFGPSTCQMLADQYATGKRAAEWMVDYVNEHLGGTANILLFNFDNKEGLVPRSTAVRDVIEAAGPTFKIVVDQLGDPQTQEFGFEVMNTVLQSNPEVNVVIGADTFVLGALSALQAAGKDDPSQYLLVGMDGEQQAIDTVASGDTSLRMTTGFALPAVGVVPGAFAARWLDGLAIPSVVTFNPITFDSADVIDAFNADMQDAQGIIGTDKQDTYFTMLGRISYDTRDAYYDGTGVPA
jgi:ribose transport system substrate-binding protein